MKILFSIFVMFFVQSTFAGSLSVSMQVPEGVVVKRLYAKYGRGGLDWCGRSPEILGSHTVKNGVLSGKVSFKKTIRDQGCTKIISYVAIDFEVYKENGNFLNFMGAMYANPFTQGTRGNFKVHIPVRSLAHAENISNVNVKCERKYIFNDAYWNYLDDSCSTSYIPDIGTEANSSIEITSIETVWPDLFQGALARTYSFPELGIDLQLFLNEKGIIGELSLMRILPSGGPISPAYPVGDHTVTYAETKNGLPYACIETWLKKEAIGMRMFFQGFNYQGSTLKKCPTRYCEKSVMTLFKIEKDQSTSTNYIE